MFARLFFSIVLILADSLMIYSSSKEEKLALNFKYFGVSDGLSSNEVNRISQDSQGFIWCATNNGLVRFDGYEFASFRSNYNDPAFSPAI